MPTTCSICIEELRSPVCLPCGHIFCNECLTRAVNATRPYSSFHLCPSCRAGFSVVDVNPNLVPAHLRPHLLPSVRRLYLGETCPKSSPASTTAPPADKLLSGQSAISECARLMAENNELRTHCGLWKKRAEVHASASLGLVTLCRALRDEARKLMKHRDELEGKVTVLKRKWEAEESFARFQRRQQTSTLPSPATSDSSSASIPNANPTSKIVAPAATTATTNTSSDALTSLFTRKHPYPLDIAWLCRVDAPAPRVPKTAAPNAGNAASTAAMYVPASSGQAKPSSGADSAECLHDRAPAEPAAKRLKAAEGRAVPVAAPVHCSRRSVSLARKVKVEELEPFKFSEASTFRRRGATRPRCAIVE